MHRLVASLAGDLWRRDPNLPLHILNSRFSTGWALPLKVAIGHVGPG